MNPKARITYRFEKETGGARREPSDKPERGPASAGKVVPFFREEMRFAADVSPWNSPFQDDPFALERLIRETDADSAGRPKQRRAEAPLPIDEAPLHKRQGDRTERTTLETDAAPVPAAVQIPLGEAALTKGGSEASARRSDESDEPDERDGLDDRRYMEAFADYSERLSEPFAPPVYEADSKGYTGFVVERRRDGGPSWLKVFASVAGALLTGALFGYVVLSLFAGEPALPAADGTAANQASPSPSSPSPSEDGKGPADAPAVPASGGSGGQAAAADLPERKYTMLQYGVFSNGEGMKAAMEELRSKGYAASADTSEGYRVYAGLAADPKEAAALGEALAGVEVYRKEIAVEAVAGFPFNGKGEDAVRFFDDTDRLIRALGGLTAGLLAAEQPEPMGVDEAKAWKEAMGQWSRSTVVFRQGVSADDKLYLDRLDQSIGTASAAVEDYEKSVSSERLRNAQTALMEAVFVQKEWMGRF